MPQSVPLSLHRSPHGVPLATRFLPGAAPALVFLPGYRSDMTGSKAGAVLAWARAAGRACLLFDYSGCGASGGDFAEGTFTRWRDEIIALIRAHDLTEVTLIGSSMGGWLMLLVAEALPDVVTALVGIAAAPDFTEWGYDADEQATLAAGEVLLRPNPYGPEPTPTWPELWHDGQTQRCLARGVRFGGPVRLLHGQADADVPWAIALRLGEALDSADVQLTLVKDGDHRLSRPADIALLLATLDRLALVAPS